MSRPPWQLRALDRLGLIDLASAVTSTDEVYDLAERFGRTAVYAVDAGYNAVVPVEVPTFRDVSVVRGVYPARA